MRFCSGFHALFFPFVLTFEENEIILERIKEEGNIDSKLARGREVCLLRGECWKVNGTN